MSVSIKFKQLELLRDLSKYFKAFPEASQKALQFAMNDVGSKSGRTMFKREMMSQVAFPTNYLNNERFSLDKRATEGDLSIVIAGRDRPTSLARFVTGGKAGGLNVRVSAQSAGQTLKGAFLVNLNNGNRGLAVRIGKGQTMRNTYGAKPLTRKNRPADDRVFLLYAPSVDQVFKDVSQTHSDQFLRMIEEEYFRQLERLNK